MGFFQQVKIALSKKRGAHKRPEEPDHAVRQLVAKEIAPEGEIIDVFQAAGLKQPDITDYTCVLIENEVEKTDYRHLDQILTYAAGLAQR